MSETLNLLLVQHAHVEGGVAANLSALEENLHDASGKHDIIVLPEMFATGYSMDAPAVAEPENLHTMKWMRLMAQRTGAVICGSLPVKETAKESPTKYYNRLIWMRPDGTFERYDKKHLFTFAGEEKVYSPGKARLIVELKGWKICPLICYDLRFPEWCRNHGTEYDLLIFCAAWPMPRVSAWETLLPARAVENQAYCLGVNACGPFQSQTYGGHSSLCDPKGNIILKAGTEPVQLSAAIEFEPLQGYREKFPVFKDADFS
ncbi:MAG: nitrilase-related carbon-nitrogen hydrolase [Bacteroidota bacterium]